MRKTLSVMVAVLILLSLGCASASVNLGVERAQVGELQRVGPVAGLEHLLVGGQHARPKDFKRADLQKILGTLQRRYDLVLVDGPAGLGRGMRNFVGLADEVLLVATPDPVSLRGVEKLAADLYAQGIRPGLLLNRYAPERVLAGQLDQPAQLAQLR